MIARLDTQFDPPPATPPQSGPPRRSPHPIWSWSAALLLTLLVMEGAARFAISQDAIFSRITSPHDEPSWRLRWLREQTGQKREAVDANRADAPPTRQSFDRHHPVRGWTLAPNLKNLPVFSGKSLSSNSRGLRGSREYAERRQLATPTDTAQPLRIALFGDSFTFGEDVSDDETFGAQLERLLGASGSPVEVLNFGVHGYGHDQMLLYLRETLPLYHPDVVLLGYVSDDSLRNLTTFRDYAKPRFRLRSGELHLEGVPVPPPEALIAREKWRSRLLDLLTMVGTRLAFSWGNRADEVDRLTEALLSTFAAEARAAGAKPAFALLPAWNELGVNDPKPLPAEALVLLLAEREKVPCLRLRPIFLEQARLGAELEQVGHWGKLEHRLAAGGIADFLRRQGLVP